MKRFPFIICTGVFVIGISGAAGGAAKSRLDTCISYYKDGDYQKAVDSINLVLPLLTDRRQEAEAYKYLGFSYVMLDKIDKAKEYFSVALNKFPGITIDTLEVPPNVASIFKLAGFEARGVVAEKKKPAAASAGRGRRTVLAGTLTGAGALCAGTGVYFFIKGRQAYREYNNTINDFNPPWKRMTRDVIIGSCATGAAAGALYFGLRLLFRKEENFKNVGISAEGDRLAVTVGF